MSEKQLTVAELLARSGKNGGSSETSRRRRRNLEDGGISVAELTGSIPKVNSKPTESKHSSQPIDVPAAAAASSNTRESDSAAQGPHSHPESFVDSASAAPFADAFPTTSRTQALKRDAAFTAVKEQAEKTQERQAADKAEELLAADSAETSTTPENTAAAIPSKEQTIVLSVVDEKDPVRLTTDSFPAVSQNSQREEVQVAADSLGMPAVASAEPTDAPSSETLNAAEETSTFAVVEDEEPYGREDDYEAYEDYAAYEEYEDYECAEEFNDEYDDYDEYYEEDEEERVSAMGVILMALAGIVLGVVIFLGFQQLWGALGKAIVAVLAVAVTGAIVGVVHALRTERDRESMILAGVAGLIMTFGPLLLS
ncbi:hypothetical protein [Corynebacterium pseudotuberculosis]|uniref:hypothetical protein n=1 Tax=Corynebacterium pseudotuberculosis TaxID=1719 RepID=UPI0001DD8471|nr:hypothetical protein [Corynebacterium pseudotuberculosis]ADK28055.1 hypothetical protein CPFRC_01350 [Corynebacterium pseudotuberculosis FRC41]ALU18866.1 hypothetical protein AK970_01330 [Corynebacterium pseudotuberculosis]